MPPERLTALDASFLYLERPAAHMHVAALSIFGASVRTGRALRFEDVRETIASRLHLAPRLRKKVVHVPLGLALPVWVDDSGFDLDLHVRRAAVPSPGGRPELMALVQETLSRPLDRSRPLWELVVIEGLEDDHVATLMKVHHALMDGLSGIQIASAMYDVEPAPQIGEPPTWRPEREPSVVELVADATRDSLTHPVRAGAHALDVARRALDEAFAQVGDVVSGIREIVDLGARPSSPFDVRVGPNRRFATTEAPFEQFRALKSALGGTVNDVVLAAVGGALHRFLRERGEPTRGLQLRVMIPVSVRADGDPFGNRVAPAFVDLPVGAMRPARRLALVRARTEHLKSSSMAMSADAVIGLGAYAPAAVLSAGARAVSTAPWFNFVVSNVPGPQRPLFMSGAPLVASYPSMPLGPTSGLSIACTSLGGTMAFGLTADRDAVPDVDRLALALDESVAELSKAADL
jgi:diacylglycerol O-acyltransferase / wax synthase